MRLPGTWWQPRVGFRPVTAEQMLAGPGPGTGPARGRLTATKAKNQGVTPGFWVKDATGATFILKFDPMDYPEMASATDVIASHLFWAAGYNAPDNAVAQFRVEDLDVSPTATFTDSAGRGRTLSRNDFPQTFSRVRREPDGSMRAIASRLLKGKPLGPFRYRGRRMDDAEDLFPHEHRRELRALWVVAAWLNHTDIRCANTMDMWVTEGGRSFVRHYLIDFGACLGSASTTKHGLPTGSEYYLDFGLAAQEISTLGLKPFSWEPMVDPDLPSVGFVEGEHFHPRAWRPDYPNPAFDERSERDMRWGARIVAGMSDELIRAAVGAGKYPDPRASEYLARVLIERRDRIAREWLPPTSLAGPLRHP